jgi:hypothetical protein
VHLESKLSFSIEYQRRSDVKLFDAHTDVIARRSSWSRVTDTEELMGVLNSFEALPQYCVDASIGDNHSKRSTHTTKPEL